MYEDDILNENLYVEAQMELNIFDKKSPKKLFNVKPFTVISLIIDRAKR